MLAYDSSLIMNLCMCTTMQFFVMSIYKGKVQIGKAYEAQHSRASNQA